MPANASNPFNSERLRPGAIDYIFPDGESLNDLIDRLQASRWRGEIIGPHGTGKSTLVQSLLPRLSSLGFEITLGTFQGGRQQWSEISAAATGRNVVIDGFEQLSRLSRARWRLITWLRGHGLIVTAHRPMGLPVLYRTCVSPDMARRVVEQLLRGNADFSDAEIAQALQSHDGNLRDTLFALYDAHEARVKPS